MALTRAGFGRHIYYLNTAQVMRIGKLYFITGLLANVDICVVKISVSLFLLRIGGLQRWLKAVLYATIVLLVSSTSATSVIIFVQCRPITANWDPIIRRAARCLSNSILTDVLYCSAGTVPESYGLLRALISVLHSHIYFHRHPLRCPPVPDP